MTIDALKDIIQRCHQRHAQPLQQKKTVVTPSAYKGLYHHFTVYCAQRYPVRLYDLEQARISFMPVGGGREHDRVPHSFGGERFLSRQGVEDWKIGHWRTSWGLRVYTGVPSEREGARWHDIEFTYQAICAAPDAVLACIETLINVVGNPLLTLTKSGGLRFSCRVPDYLHPDTQEARLYVYKDAPTPEEPYQRDVYLEILGEAGHSPWDARYELLLGDLLDPPVITKGVLFTPIDAFRSELHAPQPFGPKRPKPTSQVVNTSSPSLGSHRLDLAKEAFFKRGFSYIGVENDLHHWRARGSTHTAADVVLWETDDRVWIRASASNLGLPMEDILITDVWDDTGILPPIPATGLLASEELLAIRDGKLSPLAVKRPAPVLQKPKNTEKVYEPLEKNIGQIKRVFETDKRIIGLVAETDVRSNHEVESYLLKSGVTAYSAGFSIVEEAVKHFRSQNLPSARWRDVRFLSEQVKEIPVAERMANPFQLGNVCEDPERFLALVEKGVNARETLCPECLVYTACQERGYLSQTATLQRAKTQIFGSERAFLDPHESAVSEEILKPINDIQRLCIVGSVGIEGLFVGYGMSRGRLEEWRVRWQGHALGDFAQALMSTLEIESDPDDCAVRRIRTVVRAFQQHEAEIVRQMCQINVRGRVVEREVVDDETGATLARFGIAFEGGIFAYIPLNGSAADRLMAKELQVFQLESFVVNEDMRIPMSIERAIELGILEIGTVEKIHKFPRVYPNRDWTFWHQLKRFLAHYTRDADAPMIWYNNLLSFWVPPVLHPSMKRLLFMSTTLSAQDLAKVFPNEEIEFLRINPKPWVAGNQLFQIRSGVYTLRTLLDYDNTWDVIGLSKMAERFFLGICAEIQRDPNVKHAILTYQPIVEQLKNVTQMENVCLLTRLKNIYDLETAFEAAAVVWIVGTPLWDPGVLWRRAQILCGNDEEPLGYDADPEFQHYKDKRIQRVYTQTVAELITAIIGRAGLNRLSNKKVVLVLSLEMPDITDRPETFLFDWEDFEIAGGLDKLAETIVTRQRFEAEREQLTADTSRQEVERILGCSSRQANRMLNKLRGGNIPRVTFREQILALLANGEKKAADVVAAIDGNPTAINHELRRLVKIGEITKVGWGTYALPETSSPEK